MSGKEEPKNESWEKRVERLYLNDGQLKSEFARQSSTVKLLAGFWYFLLSFL